jgi:hypothetical protein
LRTIKIKIKLLSFIILEQSIMSNPYISVHYDFDILAMNHITFCSSLIKIYLVKIYYNKKDDDKFKEQAKKNNRDQRKLIRKENIEIKIV